eukprot:CAMPEP_0170454794 /NCGR_PEP_ID=MMETSP0123-20130129/2923_1 /TAXON_ID=182087 /ORGANISM="Favella ehrenbergii, Strain Fehren 1" /LENGTH=99 /DNA_ID=CAMNT_0010717617 /DNA_START=726 /DNA_END=1025 /DNA_ORIENTATION=-
MSLYSYLLTSCIMPVFILGRWHHEKEARQNNFLEDVPVFEKVIWFSILLALTLVKVFKMEERGIMKRFVEDYDPEVHEKLPWRRSSDPDQVVLEDANPD